MLQPKALLGGGGANGHISKGVTVRCGFDILRTSQLHLFVKNKATGTPHGVYYMQPSFDSDLIICQVLTLWLIIYLHQRGAFGVARFDEQGNAKAFRMWNEQSAWLHVFCLCPLHIINRHPGATGTKRQ